MKMNSTTTIMTSCSGFITIHQLCLSTYLYSNSSIESSSKLSSPTSYASPLCHKERIEVLLIIRKLIKHSTNTIQQFMKLIIIKNTSIYKSRSDNENSSSFDVTVASLVLSLDAPLF